MEHYSIYLRLIEKLDKENKEIFEESSLLEDKLRAEITKLHKEKSLLESTIKRSAEAIRQRNFVLEILQKEILDNFTNAKLKKAKLKFLEKLKTAENWDDFCHLVGTMVEDSNYPIDFE